MTTLRAVFDNLIAFGNATANIDLQHSAIDVKFVGGAINGYTGYATTYGVRSYYGTSRGVRFEGMAIGVASGNYIDHATAEIRQDGGYGEQDLTFYNCTWGAATRVSIATVYSYIHRRISFHKDGGTEGNDYSYLTYGNLIHNASEGVGATDCLELQPTGGVGTYLDLSNYINYMPPAPAVDGVARTVYIQLKDNAAYNGGNPEIALFQNGVLVDGWDACAVTDSYAEYGLSYTPTEDGVCRLAIRCDGNAGRIYADNFRVP